MFPFNSSDSYGVFSINYFEYEPNSNFSIGILNSIWNQLNLIIVNLNSVEFTKASVTFDRNAITC